MESRRSRREDGTVHAPSPRAPRSSSNMQTLADRAAATLARHPAPALPLDELVEQVRGGGAVVGPDVLLRALEARPDLFRVLDPWRGPWRCASPRARTQPG